MHVHNVKDFSQAKLDSAINARFLLNKHPNQDVHFCQEAHIKLRLSNINSMCLASDTPKRSDIQNKKKTHLMGTIARIFDAPLTAYSS